MSEHTHGTPLDGGQIDEIKERAAQALQNPPEPVSNTIGFYKENKTAIDVILFVGAVTLINKRLVRKVVRKENRELLDGLVQVAEATRELAMVLDVRPTEAWEGFVADLKR